MSQPVQAFAVGLAEGATYCVIDNGAPGNIKNPTTLGPIAGEPNYDRCANGAVSQGKNTFSNGNIPDCVSRSTSIINSPQTATVSFLNPA